MTDNRPPSGIAQSRDLFGIGVAVFGTMQGPEPLDDENAEAMIDVLKRCETVARELRESIEEMMNEPDDT